MATANAKKLRKRVEENGVLLKQLSGDKTAAKKVKVTLVRSPIGQKPEKRATVRSLGLKKINSVVEHEANPAILGMVAAVSHLVKVEEIN